VQICKRWRKVSSYLRMSKTSPRNIVAFASRSKNTQRGSFWRPHYSKCCASRKILLPPIRTPLEYMAMLQDWQNAKLHKHLHLYNAAFAFTSTKVQSAGFKLGPWMHTYKVKGGFYHLIGDMELAEGKLPCFLQAYVHDVANEGPNR